MPHGLFRRRGVRADKAANSAAQESIVPFPSRTAIQNDDVVRGETRLKIQYRRVVESHVPLQLCSLTEAYSTDSTATPVYYKVKYMTCKVSDRVAALRLACDF